MPFMGRDVCCDCGYENDFTEDEIEDMEAVMEEENE